MNALWKSLVAAFYLPFLFLLVCPEGLQAQPDQNLKKVFADLRAFKQEKTAFLGYFGHHGEPHPLLIELIRGGPQFTSAVCEEIDSAEPSKYPAYREALYYVLSRVKDPGSIPWLQKRIASTNRLEVSELWLNRWSIQYLRGAEPNELRQIRSPSDWSEFFTNWFNAETNSHIKFQLIKALHSSLYDPSALQFLVALENRPELEDHELLVTQVALQKRGRPINVKKLEQAIAHLSKTDGARKLLLDVAEDMPHEAFVPWLLEIVDERPMEEYGNAQWALERITFRRDVLGKTAWLRWLADNGKKTRQQWADQASSELISLAATNVASAYSFTDKAMYRWKDPIMVRTIEKLIVYKELHRPIVGWINLTYAHYHEVPGLRDRLRKLAARIELPSDDDLSNHYRSMTNSWDFVK